MLMVLVCGGGEFEVFMVEVLCWFDVDGLEVLLWLC